MPRPGRRHRAAGRPGLDGGLSVPDGWLSAFEKIVKAILARTDDIDYRALYGGTALFAEGAVSVKADGTVELTGGAKVTVRPR